MAFSANEFHHVLLVDHDSNSHASIVDMLNYFSYKVTTVNLASTAISMLSKGKAAFDIVIANINSPDFYGFKLLHEAVKMDLVVMLMLDNEDVATAAKGLEEGAFLCVTRPITMQTVKYLWQHVLREKIWKLKANKVYGRTTVYGNGFGEEGNPSGAHMTFENDQEKYHSNGNVRGERFRKEDEGCDIEDDPNLGFMKRKVWTEWTEELHEKFVDAVIQLGEGRCYPKEILDLMNVPGLTRMQVASHLQKCRGGTWLPPNERKYKTGSPGSSSPTEARAPRTRTRRYGSTPIQATNPQNIQEKSTLDEELCVNSSVGDNSTTSSDAEGYHPNIQPQDVANGYNNIAHGHVENNAGELNMWQLGLNIDMDDTYMSGEHFWCGDQVVLGNGGGFSGSLSHQGNNAHEDTLEFRNGDFMLQNSSASQQDQAGVINHNGNLHALDLEQLYSMQIPGVPDARNGQWIHEESGSVDYNKETQR